MKRLLIALGCLTVPVSLFPFPGLSAQKRAITIDDYLALKSVGNPQLSPDGKWVAYTVTEQSLKDNRGIARIWLADVASGAVRQLTAGPGSDRQPRWSPGGRTLAFVSTRANGAPLWVLSVAGGEARRVTSMACRLFEPLGLRDLYLPWPAGIGMRPLTAGRGAGNTPRYSPAVKSLAYLWMEPAVLQADPQRLMLFLRSHGRTGGPRVEATKGWTLSVGTHIW